MADQPTTLDALAAELSVALAAMEGALTPANFALLLTELGVDKPPDLSADAAFTRTLAAASNAAAAIAAGVDEVTAADDAVARADAALRLLDGIRRFGSSLHALATDFQRATAGLPGADDLARFATTLVERLMGDAVVGYLDLAHPFLRRVLSLLTVVEVKPVGFQPDDAPPVLRRVLHLDRISRLAGDPLAVFREVYGWGEATFDGKLLLANAREVFDVLVPTATAHEADEEGPADLDLFGLFVQVATGAVPPGLDLGLAAGVTGPVDLILGQLGDDLRVVLHVGGTLTEGQVLHLRPPTSLDLAGGAGVAGVVSLDIVGESPDPASPFVIFEAGEGIRLTANRIVAGLTTEFVGDAGAGTVNGDVGFHADVTGAELVVDTTDADGFITSILPADGLRAGFDVGLTWSREHGFTFRGSGALETTIAVSAQLGPVTVTGVHLTLLLRDTAVAAEVSADIQVTLGPFTAAVSRLGLAALFANRPGQDGNLGPVDQSIGFRAPTGVALAVSGGVVSGGGFLSFDPDRGEYSGSLELEFADFLALKAIGLITTRQPDGSPGFSLLMVLTAEFGSGIQLGYGFRLLAVGGLIGLNRGMNLAALVEGVRTGAIESVAFPKDVVANAPRILSDLARFFPPEQGTFLIGPMAKIGWGTPTLVSISLGVIIEIPGNIAVLGVLKAALPTEDDPLLVVQAQFVGALELDKSRLWFFAKLFDSRILTMTIDGGMGVLVAWGDNPDLVLTVGGFHPAYRPPPLPFPIPDRLSVDILNRNNQLIRVSGYFAVTSNTVQFGAKAELRLGFSAFRVEGHLGFDALFQLSPFRFAIHINAHVTLKAFGVGAFGIDLDFQLEGPAPWRAHGRGSIGFLFFSISANFDITWGEDRDTTLPPVAVLPLLANEIGKTEGWDTRLPSGDNRTLVNLRQLPETGEIVLHPLGTLFIRQRALPLGVRLDRVGGRKAGDGKRFTVNPVDNTGLKRVSFTGDRFAMGQFQTLSDAAALSRPSYETQDAGLELTADTALATARVVRRSARYELHLIDRAATPRAARLAVPQKRFHSVSGPVFDELTRGSSTSRAALSARQAAQKQPFAAQDTVRVTEQRFVVAYLKSNRQAFPPGSIARPGRATVTTFRSRATAEDALADFVTADRTLDGLLHVIPAAETVGAPGVPGTWSAAGVLPAPVSTVDAVPLATGHVLLAGGTGQDGEAVATTTLFDPTADSWATGPALGTARRRHTTTRLDDGRVLVAGGRGTHAVLATAELANQAASAWTPVAAMGVARHGHSATKLGGGRVLVAGGSGVRAGQDDGALTSCEAFDPGTGAWAPLPPMTDARTDHQAVLLLNGNVLVTGGALPGGNGRSGQLAYCEVFDRAKVDWVVTGSLAQARTGHQATLLPDGTVLVTGGDPVVAPGGTLDPHSLATAERYNPKDGTWSAAAPMPGGGRTGHRALLLSSGFVLVTGGTGTPERTAGYRSALVYDPDHDTWTTVSGLLQGRSAHAVTELPDNRVLVAAGVSGPGPADTGEVLIP
ncbi:kelch repeat-containing protein [Amycolatopsis balhimycina DSM 5908]|uniref:Kelch repeat-containing protein n=1 Tax=Amycolatopsis balhimycina DSM 5908 TaxID=1081091 RepID=A0A428WN25_AMYBA|nr:kelch repeat-containing protein [Amycolatopsis balhimycina]RSM44428.1 kelch repeat-containing protein [Amycolatopsis balhimycina DSM 5908]